MACSKMLDTWTFSTLVASYLDLCLVYLLLCCSALAFFCSKLLSLLGLSLPCPCNGLFSPIPSPSPFPYDDLCLHRLLSSTPFRRISAVQSSVRSRFPFNLLWPSPAPPLASALQFDAGGESSASHNSADTPGPRARHDASNNNISSFCKQPSGLCRRRRALASADRSKASTASSSSTSIRRKRHLDLDGESSANVESGGDQNAPRTGADEVTASNDSDGLHGEDEDYSFSVKELVRARGGGIDGKEAETIRILEQALAEEHAARIALYLELEKERNAAATAADETMAMILRLQEEKASIEMEARQYQRVIEDKSVYDEEEMNILKEILVWREREIHFLENEVVIYRQMLYAGEANQQTENNLCDMADETGKIPCPSFNIVDDPTHMLQKINVAFREKEIQNATYRFSEDDPSAKVRGFLHLMNNNGCTPQFRAEDVDLLKHGTVRSIEYEDFDSLSMAKYVDAHSEEFQEKGMVYADEGPSGLQGNAKQLELDSSSCKLNGSRTHSLHKRAYNFSEEHLKEERDEFFHEAVEGGDGSHNRNEMRIVEGAEKRDRGSQNIANMSSLYQACVSQMESGVHDVHVIDDKSKMPGKVRRKESEVLLVDTTSKSSDNGLFPPEISNDDFKGQSSLGSTEAKGNFGRSFSDVSVRLPPRDGSQSKVASDLRRSSISSVDYERLKLETEVDRLRERLKVVQKGREKLSFNVDHRERERSQFQLLEDISRQLDEIRLLIQPRRASRQASLPPSSSKACSKKRRCRSVSWGIQDSS